MAQVLNDFSVVGLDRIYNGKPKTVNLINPNNYNLVVSYINSNNEVIECPKEVGEYKVIVKNDNVKVTRTMYIKKKEDTEFNDIQITSNEEVVEESNEKVVEASNEEVVEESNQPSVKVSVKKKKDSLMDNVSYYGEAVKKQPKLIAGLGVLAYALFKK